MIMRITWGKLRPGSWNDFEKTYRATVAAKGGKLGVAVRPLTSDEKRDNEIEHGVVVQNVSGAAERAGVRPGDVIVAVNNTPVKSVDELRNLVDKAGKTVALLVQRQDARIFIPVTLG